MEAGEVSKPETGSKGPKFYGKVFLHGVLFTLLFIVFWFGWAFATLILVSIGSIIGLGLAFGLLCLGIGGINAFLGVQLWKVEADTSFWSLFFHGLVLFVILLFAGGLTTFLPNLVFPGVATSVISIVITSLVYGLVGKEVAEWF